MIVDESYILKHYGTKGMKWGRRKKQEPRRRISTKKKVAIGAGATVAIGAGATVLYLRRSGSVKVKNIDKSFSKETTEQLNQAFKRMYEEGIIWDKQGLGRGPGPVWNP